MKYENESNMPGPGDWQTWPPCTGHPNDLRGPIRTEEEPDDDFLDKSDPRETDELYERDEQW